MPPANEGHHAGPRPQPAPDGDDPPCAALPGSRPADEDRVDREAHEQHVDPVLVGQPEGRPGRQRRPAHQAQELGPQAAGDLDPLLPAAVTGAEADDGDPAGIAGVTDYSSEVLG